MVIPDSLVAAAETVVMNLTQDDSSSILHLSLAQNSCQFTLSSLQRYKNFNCRSLETYRATLGHFVNHGPVPNCWFGMIDHPRFGKVRSTVLTRDVEANEELLTHYGFLDNYVQTEGLLKKIFDFGKLITSDNDANDGNDGYVDTMKRHIRFLRSKADEMKPVFEVLKTAAKVFGSK